MSNYVPPTTPIGGPAGQPFPPQQPFPAPPEKKSKALMYILVGCGTFVLLAVIAVAIGGYFVWNKAKEAGLDPELMQKHPAVATAKMLVAMNPDIELVSVDEEKELITVKDKKTGETVTVTLNEAKNGKITFKKDGEEAVTLEAKGDESQGSLELKSADGKAKFGSGSIDKLPDWLPVYPESVPEGSYSTQAKEGESGGFHFTTKDAPNKVVSFYEEGLKRTGMTVNTNLLQQDGKSTGGMATGEDSTKKRTAYINAAAGDQGTEVTVIFTTKP
jgi:hypothetical protein